MKSISPTAVTRLDSPPEESRRFDLSPATPADHACIENLMRLFNYDISEWYPVDIADDGRVVIQPKDTYWTQPGVLPFLLRVDGQLAGFAIIDGDTVDSQTDYNLGWFFVARRYRGLGLGRRMLERLLKQYPGRWEIYHLARNVSAAQFWRRQLRAPLVRDVCESAPTIHAEACVLFNFTVAPGAA